MRSEHAKRGGGFDMSFRDWLFVVITASAAAFLGAVFATVAPVLPLIAAHYGGGRTGAFIAEWLLTMPSIGIALGGPIAGWFVERAGPRAVLLVCLTVFGASELSGLVIQDSTLLLASRLIVGVAAAGQATAATVLVGDRFAGHRRGFVIGLQVALATVAGILATLAAGALAERAGWRAPFSLFAIALVIALLAAVTVEPSAAYRRPSQSAGGTLRPLLPIFLLMTITMMVSFLSANQVPLLLSDEGISEPSTLSSVVGGTTLATMIGALLYSKLRAKLGDRRTRALGGVLQGIGVFCLAVAQGLVPVALGSMVLGLGSGVLFPGFSHSVLDRAPDAARGRAIGFLFTAQFAGPFLSTALIAPSIAAVGRRDGLMAIGAAVLIIWLATATRRSAQVIRHSVGPGE
jgi:MFS family permease